MLCDRAVSSDDIDNTEDNSAASTWLQELGIDQSRYRSLDPAKIREYLLLSVTPLLRGRPSRRGAEIWTGVYVTTD